MAGHESLAPISGFLRAGASRSRLALRVCAVFSLSWAVGCGSDSGGATAKDAGAEGQGSGHDASPGSGKPGGGGMDGGAGADAAVAEPTSDLTGELTGKLRISADDLQRYQNCTPGLSTGKMDDAALLEALSTLGAWEDGAQDLPLSTDGCIRFLRTVKNGETTRAAFVQYVGIDVDTSNLDNFDPSTIDFSTFDAAAFQPSYFAVYSTLARWDAQSDGSVKGSVGTRADHVYAPDEAREVTTVERVGYEQTTLFDRDTMEMFYRSTIEVDADGFEDWTEESWDSDQLFKSKSKSVANPERARMQKCKDEAKPCSKEDVQQLEADLQQALKQGVKCLEEYKFDAQALAKLVALREAMAKKHEWRCMTDGCDFLNAKGLDGKNKRIDVDMSFYRGGSRQRSGQERAGILFHELLHPVLGGHNSALIDSALTDASKDVLDYTSTQGQRLSSIDRVYACQAFCFEDVQTACSCAKCLDKKTCDEPCAGFAACTAAECSVDTGTCVRTVSEDMAACVKTDSAGAKTYEWFLTPDQCRMSGCEGGASAGKCEPFGTSCRNEK